MDALDRIETTADELDAVEQREAGLEAEVTSRLAEETNRNLYLLAIVTVRFAPMTLITGIFGMNVGGLPGLADPRAFRWVTGWMVALSAGLLAAPVLRLRRGRRPGPRPR